MTNKELTLLGMALKALIEIGEIEKAKEIIDYMANDAIFKEDKK
jgi:hypothetical protein